MAVLRDVSGQRAFPLRDKITVIGRDPACDIVVNDPQTSARHALIVNAGGAFVIEDLKSTNGTFVNGQRIQQRTPLCPNDRIEVFGLTATFHEDEKPEVAFQRTLLGGPDREGPTITSSFDLATGLRLEVAAEAKLRAILEISKNLSNTLALEQVLPRILESLFAIFPQADRGFILLRDPNTAQLVTKAVRQRRPSTNESLTFSRTIVNHALSTCRAILSADAGLDERFDPSHSIQQLEIHSIMCMPMVSQAGASLGVIQIDTQDRRKQFRQEDLDVLVSASTQAARAVELAWLHQEQRDMEAATQIQKSFLPSERPSVAELRFFDYYSPARHIGGDYYDYIRLPNNRLAVALGDVSGKGVPAALLMAKVSASVRFCLATEPQVAQAVRDLNAVLTRADSADRFVTFVVVVLDLDSHVMTLVNAGHLPPLRRRADGAVEELGDAIAGLPLAILDRPYEELAVALEPGDTLILYTDGVTEARDPQGELYGMERLRAVVQGAPEEVEELGSAILADVRRFAAGRPQSDDLTIVCLSRQR